MKIAVTSDGPTLDDQVGQTIGRSPYHLIVDTDDMSVEAVENPLAFATRCAGIPAAVSLVRKGVGTVLTGICGPQPIKPLWRSGIDVIVGVTGQVRTAVEKFKAGGFSAMTEGQEWEVPEEQSKHQ